MKLEETNINIRTKVFRELYRLTWCIENFDMMPFCDELSVCSPSFLLGKHRSTTWNMVLKKQIHQGKENVGFRFDKEEDTNWNMVTVSLSVMLQDGRLVKCIDQEVLVQDSESRFEFLMQPSKPKQASLKNGMDASTQVENGRGRSVEVPKIQNFNAEGRKMRNVVKETTPKAKPIEVILSPKVDNSHGLDGSIIPENESSSLDKSEFKKSDKQEDIIAKPDTVSGPPKVENCRSLKRQPKKTKSGRTKESEVLTSEAPKSVEELTPEDLLKQKDLTVVCRIEYIYVMSTNLAKNEQESVQSDLMGVFKYLYETRKFCDITVECKGTQFLCHKAVLCPRSRIIGELLQIGGLPSPLTVNLNMQQHIAKAFLLYLYTDEFPDVTSDDDCRQLCKVAETFGVQGMRKKCLALMKSLEYQEFDLEKVDARLDKTSEALIWIVFPKNQ